jgi:hypothetical protein
MGRRSLLNLTTGLVKVGSMNPCVFSPDRRFRYTLLHEWDQLFEPKLAAVIALNPSTADESDLDPTLRRIRGFCIADGLSGFCMLNLFAYRATDPTVMKAQTDPVGPANDRHILQWARRAERVIVAWGTHGRYLGRDRHVLCLLQKAGIQPYSWGQNSDGSPRHPLYLPRATPLVPYSQPETAAETATVVEKRS